MRGVLTMISRVVIAAPKRVLLVVMLLTVLAAVFGANVAEHLGAGGFQDPSSQSARGVKVLTEKFGLGNMDLTLVVRSPSGVLEPAAAEAGRRLVDEVRNAPYISGVVSPWDDESARREGLISEDGKTALVIARVSGGENNAPKYAKDVADRVSGEHDGLTVLAGGIRAALHRALLGETLGALEEQLGAFAPAEAAARTHIAGHRSDPPLLGRPTPIVGNRGDVADRDHPETDRRECLNRRFAAAAGALHPHMHPPNSEVHRLTTAVFRGDGGCKRRGLLRAFEAGLAGRAPGKRVAFQVRNRDQQVVERRRDVGDPFGFDHFLTALDTGPRRRG